MPRFARNTLLLTCFLYAIVFWPALPAAADLVPIQLDGFFEDWLAVSPLAADDPNDGGTVDFANVWVANDQDYLYIRFETGGEVQPDEQQDIRLYMDTDMNAGTGTSFNGIGAELVWQLGNRTGTFYSPGATTIDHPDIGLLIGPTVSNTEFEVALRRDALPNGSDPLFPGGQVRFVLRDVDSGDTMPDSGGLSYVFAAGSDVPPTLDLGKADPADIRLASWNVQSDGLFDGGSTEAAQERVLSAIDPDVLIVCEVWNHDAGEVVDQIEQLLPSGAGEHWYGVKRDQGNVIVSRFPIIDSWEINPGYRETAALLDLGGNYDTDLLVIANHWRCCSADYDRQQEADGVVEFMKDARTAGGVINLPVDTPIVLGGDFNLVGWRQQLDTVVTGDIVNNGSYGPDSPPDWDGTDLAVPPSRHPDGRASYTWRNDYSSYYPGMLDWILYTDSVMSLQNHYILETRTMLPATLSTNGLLINDTITASDHAPRVADFSLSSPAAPAAGFGLAPSNGCAPLTVGFTDESLNDVSSWQWDFGDGSQGTEQNPVHIYAVPGSYEVRLIVSGTGGVDTLAVAGAVTVAPAVMASFTVSDTLVGRGSDVTFTDTSAGSPTTWLWDFGDATTDTVADPIHAYANDGTYDVILVVGNACSADTLVMAAAVRVNGVSAVAEGTPLRFGLGQNYPNPFNPCTTFIFSLEKPAHTRLEIFDLSGRRVATLVDGGKSAGRHEISWRPVNLASGIYFSRLTAGDRVETRRVILLK